MSEDMKVIKYMGSDMVRSRFSDIVGENNAASYIGSVLLSVAENQALQQCSPQSVYTSAMRAATLRLSVDPSLGQAYLVPFKGSATLIVGYKGLHDLAVRTGKYRYINAGPVYEGEVVNEDRISGFHSLGGARTSKKIIGWIAAFEMFDGYAKTMYMTVTEIHEHARKYSKSYNSDKSGWKTDTDKMERKTVLRLLLRRWGYLNPTDAATLAEIDNGEVEPAIEGEIINRVPEEPEEPKQPKNEDELLDDLGYEDKEPKETKETPILPGLLVAGSYCADLAMADLLIKDLKLSKANFEDAVKAIKGYNGWRDLGATYSDAIKYILKGEYPK